MELVKTSVGAQPALRCELRLRSFESAGRSSLSHSCRTDGCTPSKASPGRDAAGGSCGGCTPPAAAATSCEASGGAGSCRFGAMSAARCSVCTSAVAAVKTSCTRGGRRLRWRGARASALGVSAAAPAGCAPASASPRGSAPAPSSPFASCCAASFAACASSSLASLRPAGVDCSSCSSCRSCRADKGGAGRVDTGVSGEGTRGMTCARCGRSSKRRGKRAWRVRGVAVLSAPRAKSRRRARAGCPPRRAQRTCGGGSARAGRRASA